jgi:hypothetical protein
MVGMNQFPSPALVFLPWLYLPVVVLLLTGLCALMFDGVRRTRRARLVPIPVAIPEEDGGDETTGETPAGPDTSRP